MRRTGFGYVVAVVLVVGALAPAAAQETKSARGTVTALAADSISVRAGEQMLTLTVDAKTVLTASGAGTANRRAEAAGKPGPRLADFVKAGDAVAVGYQDVGGRLRATSIQKISSAGGGGGSTSDAKPMTSTGTVSAISGSLLTITGATGGGTFTQSFTITRETTVVAAGAGTASAKGGGLPFTSAVGVGDQVSVAYRQSGDALHAEEVRVTRKKG